MELVNKTTGYMIRNSLGLFSSGGARPVFRTVGKVYSNLAQVKSHLAIFRTFQGVNQVPDSWEVVEVAVVPQPNAINAREMAQPLADKQYQRQGKYKDKWEKRDADNEKRQLKRLKAKYEPPATEWRTGEYPDENDT